MQEIKKPAIFDVDDTLILWDKSAYPNAPTVTVSFGKHKDTVLAVHEKNVNLLKKFSRLGYQIMVFSQTGADWAKCIIDALGIEQFVDYYGTKPMFYIDDKGADSWMQRVWRDPVTGKEGSDVQEIEKRRGVDNPRRAGSVSLARRAKLAVGTHQTERQDQETNYSSQGGCRGCRG